MIQFIEECHEHQRVDAGRDADQQARAVSAQAGERPGEGAEEGAGGEDREEHARAVLTFDDGSRPPEDEAVAEQVPEAVVEHGVGEPLPGHRRTLP